MTDKTINPLLVRHLEQVARYKEKEAKEAQKKDNK